MLNAQDDSSEAETEILSNSQNVTPAKVTQQEVRAIHTSETSRMEGENHDVMARLEPSDSATYESKPRVIKRPAVDAAGGADGDHQQRLKDPSSKDLLPLKHTPSSPDAEVKFDDADDQNSDSHNRRRRGLEKRASEGELLTNAQALSISSSHLTSPRASTHEPLPRPRSPTSSSNKKRSLSFHSSLTVSARKNRQRSHRSPSAEHSDLSPDDHPRNFTRLTKSTPTAPPTLTMTSRRDIDRSGRTPLARACADGDLDKVTEILSQSTADLNKADHAGNTPLQIASLNGAPKIVRALIHAGCDLLCVNDVGDTPLIDAVENAQIAVIKALLDAGVDAQRSNAKGQYPKDLIPDGASRNGIEKLLDHAISSRNTGDPQDGSLTLTDGTAAAAPSRPSVRRNSNDLHYVTPSLKKLVEYCKIGDVRGTDYMIQSGLKPTNACMVAASTGGHVDILNLLLAEGGIADPDPESVAPETTPMLAAIGRGHPSTVELLLQQAGFDARRRTIGDRRYYQLAEHRKGPIWAQEHAILFKAFHNKGGHAKSNAASSSSTSIPVHPTRKPTEPVPSVASASPTSPPKRRKLLSGMDLAMRARVAYVDSMPAAIRHALNLGKLQLRYRPAGFPHLHVITKWHELHIVRRFEIDPGCSSEVADQLWTSNMPSTFLLGHNRLDDMKVQLNFETIPGTMEQRVVMLETWGWQNWIYRDIDFAQAPREELDKRGIEYDLQPDGEIGLCPTPMRLVAVKQFMELPQDQLYWVRIEDVIEQTKPKYSPHLVDFTTELNGSLHLDWVKAPDGRWDRKKPLVPDVRKVEWFYKNGIAVPGLTTAQVHRGEAFNQWGP